MAKLAASEAATFISHQVFSVSPFFSFEGLIIIHAQFVTTIVIQTLNVYVQTLVMHLVPSSNFECSTPIGIHLIL